MSQGCCKAVRALCRSDHSLQGLQADKCAQRKRLVALAKDAHFPLIRRCRAENRSDFCLAGWQHHPVGSSTFHFIIPSVAASAAKWPQQSSLKAELQPAIPGLSDISKPRQPASAEPAETSAAPTLQTSGRTRSRTQAARNAGLLPAASADASSSTALPVSSSGRGWSSASAEPTSPSTRPADPMPATAACSGAAQVASIADSYTSPNFLLESHSHLLHGVIHINGYGHLLRINGREGGSPDMTGGFLINAAVHAGMSTSAFHSSIRGFQCGDFPFAA